MVRARLHRFDNRDTKRRNYRAGNGERSVSRKSFAYNTVVRFAVVLAVFCAVIAACSTTPQVLSVRRQQAAHSGPCVEPLLELERLPRLGERLSHAGQTCTLTMGGPAQTWPAYSIVGSGLRFTVGVDSDAIVRFLSTTDPTFAPAEGLHVGDAAAAALKAAPTEQVVTETGWGHYIRLPSGWSAFLDDTRIDADGHLELNAGTRDLRADAKITMFFKRD